MIDKNVLFFCLNEYSTFKYLSCFDYYMSMFHIEISRDVDLLLKWIHNVLYWSVSVTPSTP